MWLHLSRREISQFVAPEWLEVALITPRLASTCPGKPAEFLEEPFGADILIHRVSPWATSINPTEPLLHFVEISTLTKPCLFLSDLDNPGQI